MSSGMSSSTEYHGFKYYDLFKCSLSITQASVSQTVHCFALYIYALFEFRVHITLAYHTYCSFNIYLPQRFSVSYITPEYNEYTNEKMN